MNFAYIREEFQQEQRKIEEEKKQEKPKLLYVQTANGSAYPCNIEEPTNSNNGRNKHEQDARSV